MEESHKVGLGSKVGAFFGALIGIPLAVLMLGNAVGADLREARNIFDTFRGEDYNCAEVEAYFDDISPSFHDLREVMDSRNTDDRDFMGTAAYVYAVAQTVEPSDDLQTFHTHYTALAEYFLGDMVTDARLSGGDESLFAVQFNKYVDPVSDELRNISRHCPDETKGFRKDLYGYNDKYRFA